MGEWASFAEKASVAERVGASLAEKATVAERFFVCAQFLTFSLIINGEVGSFASLCFPQLLKNCAPLLTCCAVLRKVRSEIKFPCMLLCAIFFCFHSSYTRA
jgi:hypothetical protein